MPEDYTDDQVEWHLDQIQNMILGNLKIEYSEHMRVKDLENAYWTLRRLKSEVAALPNEKEEPNFKDKVKELDEVRDEYIADPNEDTLGKYYIALEEFFEFLCKTMQNYGLYYRKKGDDDGL